LRSPHNSHLTVLARSGVPGFLLWVMLHVGWLWGMMSHYIHCRRTGDVAWAGVFAFLTAYYTALMINAGFDVVLESPMGGIWMWTLFGTGLAAMHLHAHHPDTITLT
jgi:O-antigen ligase